MEKYSKWRDPGTGIQIFLHPKPPLRNKEPLDYILLPFRYLLMPVRLVLITLLLLILYLVENLLWVLVVPLVVVKAQGIVRLLILRVVLFLGGFYFIKTVEKKVPKIQSANTKQTNLYLSNYSSYVDVIFYACFYSSRMLLCRDDKVREYSYWELLFTSQKCIDETVDMIPASQYFKLYDHRMPLVVFVEGTTSNGKGLLQFQLSDRVLSEADKMRVIIVGVKYDYQQFCPSYTTDSKFQHISTLLTMFENKATFYISNGPVDDKFSSKMSELTRLKQVKYGIQDKLEFLNYYQQKSIKK